MWSPKLDSLPQQECVVFEIQGSLDLYHSSSCALRITTNLRKDTGKGTTYSYHVRLQTYDIIYYMRVCVRVCVCK